jgi:hypothetical protein
MISTHRKRVKLTPQCHSSVASLFGVLLTLLIIIIVRYIGLVCVNCNTVTNKISYVKVNQPINRFGTCKGKNRCIVPFYTLRVKDYGSFIFIVSTLNGFGFLFLFGTFREVQ